MLRVLVSLRRFISSLEAAESIQGTRQYIKAARCLSAVFQLSSFFSPYASIEPVSLVLLSPADRAAAAARPGPARLVLHADLRRLRPDPGPGLHVRGGQRGAADRGGAGGAGAAGGGVRRAAGDARAAAGGVLRRGGGA